MCFSTSQDDVMNSCIKGKIPLIIRLTILELKDITTTIFGIDNADGWKLIADGLQPVNIGDRSKAGQRCGKVLESKALTPLFIMTLGVQFWNAKVKSSSYGKQWPLWSHRWLSYEMKSLLAEDLSVFLFVFSNATCSIEKYSLIGSSDMNLASIDL